MVLRNALGYDRYRVELCVCVCVCVCVFLIEVYTKGIGVGKDCQSHTIHVFRLFLIVYHSVYTLCLKNAQSLHYF